MELLFQPVIYLEMQFPQDYPMAPPFVRVTKPRFKFLTGTSDNQLSSYF